MEHEIDKIILVKPAKGDRRFKTDNFGVFDIKWFYNKLQYKAKNQGIQFQIIENNHLTTLNFIEESVN